MIVGLILVGIVFGSAAGIGALLLGSSIWIALLTYTAISAASVLGLAMSIALRSDLHKSAEQAKPYTLAGPQRG